jgi:hypothetical protein
MKKVSAVTRRPVTARPKQIVVICERCRGVNVMTLDWVDANFPVILGGADTAFESETWCADCDDNTRTHCITLPAEKAEQRLAARRAWLETTPLPPQGLEARADH